MRATPSERRAILILMIAFFALLGLIVEKDKVTSEGKKEVTKPRTVKFPININEADVATLETLPGIGREKAEEIVAFRERNGPFDKPEDIMKVSGIGKSTFDKIRNKITTGVPSKSTNVRKRMIDLNTADLEDLMELPYIGKVKAKSILEYREKHGPFRKIEDILKVPGIGPKTFDRIKDKIFVRGGE